MKKQNDTSEILKELVRFITRRDRIIQETGIEPYAETIKDFVDQALHKRDEYWKGRIEALRMRSIRHITDTKGIFNEYRNDLPKGLTDAINLDQIELDGYNQAVSELNTNIDILLEKS